MIFKKKIILSYFFFSHVMTVLLRDMSGATDVLGGAGQVLHLYFVGTGLQDISIVFLPGYFMKHFIYNGTLSKVGREQ